MPSPRTPTGELRIGVSGDSIQEGGGGERRIGYEKVVGGEEYSIQKGQGGGEERRNTKW